MANKNKNNLVAQSDDDPTSEIEIPAALRNSDSFHQPEIEVDEQTFDIDELRPKTEGFTRNELKSEIERKSEIAEELNFELEQLRARQRGLDAELAAREEIAEQLQRDLADAQEKSAGTLRKLEARDDELKSVQSDLEKARQEAGQLRDKTTGLQTASKDFKRKIKSLESELATGEKKNKSLERELRNLQKRAQDPSRRKKKDNREIADLRTNLKAARTELDDLRNYVNGRTDSWERLKNELLAAHEQLAAKDSEIASISAEADDRNSQLVRSREQVISTSEQLAQQKAKVRKLGRTKRELEHKLHNEAAAEIAANRVRIEKQQGDLAGKEQELARLAADNERIERYTDTLRLQLQDQQAISKAYLAIRQKLEAGLDVANDTIDRLSEELEKARDVGQRHVEAIEQLRTDFEQEIRQVRFELGAAQETLSGQETINEQLASDLIDHREFRQALESQISELEKENEKTIRNLSRELKHAQKENEENARKLHFKDNAIAELIQELSIHTNGVEPKDDFDSALQKIDGFRPESNDSPFVDSRERVARLLIGNVDGRALRFPLFKDRLTIGRTSHNDIQLNRQYVSRRHAVISTDNGQTRIIDWGSKNGVYVNRKAVKEKVLQSGDVVSIGMADFRYEERIKR